MGRSMNIQVVLVAVLVCFVHESAQSSLFQNFLNEAQPLFTTGLSELGKLVNLALSQDDTQSFTVDTFHNPAIKDAIRDTHTPLTAALSIANRHVAEYDSRIAAATIEISDVEAQIRNHQATMNSLNSQRTELQNMVSSLQSSIDHHQRMINDNRAQLESQQGKLRTVRKRRKFFGFVTVILPPVGLAGVLLSNRDVDRIKGNIRSLEGNLENFRNSKQQTENQLNNINAQIQATDQTIRDTQSQVQQKQTSLQTLQNERSLIIELGIKLKNSTSFLSLLQGKVDVIQANNHLTVFLESVLNSLEDLLIFLARNIDSHVAPLTTTQGLQQLRELLRQSLTETPTK